MAEQIIHGNLNVWFCREHNPDLPYYVTDRDGEIVTECATYNEAIDFVINDTESERFFLYREMSEHHWETPSDYAGFNPQGDVVVYCRSRDSHLLETVNYERILEDLEKLNEQYVAPEIQDEDEFRQGDCGYIYSFRAMHWAVGWVQTTLMRKDAPPEIQQAVWDVKCSLNSYPCYDDTAYSKAQHEACQDYWDGMDEEWRGEMYVDAGYEDPGSYPKDYTECPQEVQEQLRNTTYY